MLFTSYVGHALKILSMLSSIHLELGRSLRQYLIFPLPYIQLNPCCFQKIRCFQAENRKKSEAQKKCVRGQRFRFRNLEVFAIREQMTSKEKDLADLQGTSESEAKLRGEVSELEQQVNIPSLKLLK